MTSGIRWAGHVAVIVETRDAYKREWKRPVGRSKCTWEEDLKESGFKDLDWICMAQDKVQRWALLNTVMNLWV